MDRSYDRHITNESYQSTHIRLVHSTILGHFKTPFVNPFKRSQPNPPCRLPILDPWDKTILKYLNPQFNPLTSCKPTYKARFAFNQEFQLERVNGFEEAEDERCYYSCLFSVSDLQTTQIKFVLIDSNVDSNQTVRCDVVEIKCQIANETTYRDVIYQVYRDLIKNPIQNTTEKAPNVFILGLDSFSSSQAVRSLPKTMHFLQHQLGGVHFAFMSKNAENTKPNTMSLFFGQRVYRIPESPFDDKSKQLPPVPYCYEYLDSRPYVLYDFLDAGYELMNAEDWLATEFMYPNCFGFKRIPFNHTFKGMAKLMKRKDLKQVVQKQQCKEATNHILEYTEKYLKVYADKPTVTLLFLTDLAHDNVNGGYHVDDAFYQFFKRNEQHLRDSFVLLFADHGNRLARIHSTSIGRIEDKNPMLVLSVPEELRRNPTLMSTLNLNSRRLISHYDTYVTLKEIAKYGKTWTETTDFELLVDPALTQNQVGTSYLHPISDNRTCNDLQIPFQYCVCEETKVPVNDVELAKRAIRVIIDHMNEQLKSTPETTSKCAELSLNEKKPFSLIQHRPESKRHVYFTTFAVNPSNGSYVGFVEVFLVSNHFIAMTNISSPYTTFIYCENIFLSISLIIAFLSHVYLVYRTATHSLWISKSSNLMVNMVCWTITGLSGTVYANYLILSKERLGLVIYITGLIFAAATLAVNVSVTTLLLERICIFVRPTSYRKHRRLFTQISALCCFVAFLYQMRKLQYLTMDFSLANGCTSFACVNALIPPSLFNSRLFVGSVNLTIAIVFNVVLRNYTATSKTYGRGRFKKVNRLTFYAAMSEITFNFAPNLISIITNQLDLSIWQTIGTYTSVMIAFDALVQSAIFTTTFRKPKLVNGVSVIPNSRLVDSRAVIIFTRSTAR
ncbi:hypothetical protein M3Y95_00272300 [Aphelenchoides besseyi]|nr:hypothetical protein M3Y95_00272300 [Aphelenchoides besseyi]